MEQGVLPIQEFDSRHLARIERLLEKYRGPLAAYRFATLARFGAKHRVAVSRMFVDFERVLGPVGAAKTLYLLAPRVFPLWDRSIAAAYDLSLRQAGSNGDRYWSFMLIARDQWVDLTRRARLGGHVLKAIDEYNYCRHTKGWIR